MPAVHEIMLALVVLLPLLAWLKASAELDALDDAELVKLARGSNPGAYAVLVNRYKKRIYAVAYRMVHTHEDADDIAQEAFVRAYQALDSFDTERAFYTWLCRIAMNLAINLTDKWHRRATDSLDEREETAGFEPAGSDDASAGVQQRELQRAVNKAVKELPDGMREVFVLRTFEDMSYEEIAEALAVPRGTVMSRLARARERVQQALAPFVQDRS